MQILLTIPALVEQPNCSRDVRVTASALNEVLLPFGNYVAELPEQNITSLAQKLSQKNRQLKSQVKPPCHNMLTISDKTMKGHDIDDTKDVCGNFSTLQSHANKCSEVAEMGDRLPQ